MHQRHPWIWFLVKAAAAVIAFVGVLVAFYYSRSGQQIAEKSNAIGRESNEGAIKSICTGSQNLSLADRLWCDEWSASHSMAAIFGSLSSAATDLKNWLDLKMTSFGICGIYSAVERSGDTCLSIGLLFLILMSSRSIDKPLVSTLLRDNMWSLVPLSTSSTVGKCLAVSFIAIVEDSPPDVFSSSGQQLIQNAGVRSFVGPTFVAAVCVGTGTSESSSGDIAPAVNTVIIVVALGLAVQALVCSYPDMKEQYAIGGLESLDQPDQEIRECWQRSLDEARSRIQPR